MAQEAIDRVTLDWVHEQRGLIGKLMNCCMTINQAMNECESAIDVVAVRNDRKKADEILENAYDLVRTARDELDQLRLCEEYTVGSPFVPPPTVEDEIEKTEGDFETELRKLIMKHSGTPINGYKPDPVLIRDHSLVVFINNCLTIFKKREIEKTERFLSKSWKSEKGERDDEEVQL